MGISNGKLGGVEEGTNSFFFFKVKRFERDARKVLSELLLSLLFRGSDDSIEDRFS